MLPKTLLLLLIVNLVYNAYGQKAKKFFRKDYKYMEEFESFYKIHTIPRNWAGAKRVCELEGTTLWHPDNDDEAHALLSYWNETTPKIEWIFVGLSDLLVEGVFKTVDGKSISEVYNNWEPDQPDNNGARQHCVYMYLNEGPGYLDDYYCHKMYSFICKKPLKSLEWNQQCNFPNLAYTYNIDNGKCYKLHTTALNWTEAYPICELEQSSLAVISNRLEADFLAKLIESTPKPKVKGKYQAGIYHVGFHNRLNEGWQTVKGSHLSVNPEAWFDNYEPDGDDQCGAIFYTGLLINMDCDTRSFFICQYDPVGVIVPIATGLTSSPIIEEPYSGGGIE